MIRIDSNAFFVRLALALALLAAVPAQSLSGSELSTKPVKVILDSDMISDFDDVGALACLHALADAGECEILATLSCTRANRSVAAIEIVNAFYGRPDIPVGCTKQIGVAGGGVEPSARSCPLECGGHAKYVQLAKDYPQWVKHLNSDDAPDANEVYRRILAAQPDHSVVLCSIGFLTNMRRLLETKADAISPLDGPALVAKKVKLWVAMACKYPKGQECNSLSDAESSTIALEKWPTPIVFTDFDYGRNVYTGRRVAEDPRAKGPVKDIFSRCLMPRSQCTATSWDRAAGHPSWDETAVLYAVRGAGKVFGVERGTYRMVGTDGSNVWTADPKSRDLRLVEKMPYAEVGQLIDELICRRPGNRTDCPCDPVRRFAAGTVAFHVDAVRGNDAAAGTAAAPFRTPRRARDAVRKLKADGKFPAAGVAVELHGRFSSTHASLLSLTAEDSGLSATAPVVWRAGKDGARFTGSMPIAASAFKPVAGEDDGRLRAEVRSRVLVADLAALGVGPLPKLPDSFRRWETLELFADGQALPVARYPNRGWLTFDQPIDRGVGPDPGGSEFERGIRGGKFVAEDPAVCRWTRASEARLFGYWCWDWYGEFIRLGSVDPQSRVITLAAPSAYGIGHAADWQKSKIRYCALNLLEELDAPGEWYVDRVTRKLYLLPPPAGLKQLELALATAPLISGEGFKHVRFEGLQFRFSTGPAVVLRDCEAVTLAGLNAEWMTTDAVRLERARNCTVRGCRIAHIGTTALAVTGGDRRTLTKSGNLIADNDLGHAGRLARINGRCLTFGGCGITVEHNYLHDTPYICIGYGGNEHLFQYNIVECAMLEAGDGAGVYTGRDWGSRGNVLRWNFFNSFGADGVELRQRQGRPSGCEALTGDIMVEGLYLDDCDSGEEIYGNIFHKAGRAMFTGGGRDNRWHHNLVIGCRSAAFLDTRGLQRARLGTGIHDGWDLLQKVEAFKYKEEPWRSRYPSLVTTMENDPLLPLGTAYFENVAIGCETFFNCQGLAYGMLRTTLENRGNVTVNQTDRKRDLDDYPQHDPTSRAKLEFRDDAALATAAAADPLRVQDTPAFRKAFPNFPRIPVEQLGPRENDQKSRLILLR